MSRGDRPLRIVSIGGGPAGLLAAALVRRRFPQHEVTVLERNAPDATFGFGVVFSARTLAGLRDVDPAVHAAIDAASSSWRDIEVRHRGETLRCGGHGMSAIARTRLLAILQQHAADAGAELRFETEATPELLAGADVVLGADGVNSGVRTARAEVFEPRVEQGRAKYIWFAATTPFDALTFAFAEDEHGWWGVHAYPFDGERSTFIVETDEGTWRRAGLDQAGELPLGASDLRSLAYCERLFADVLGGGRLLENNSRWLTFGTLRTGRWHEGNTVLLGDAAHTAHFSVGSGTKMAMEDAIALVDVLGEADDVPTALAAYERVRRPQVEHIQRAADPSMRWWERFRHVAADEVPERFAFHFLTRSPIVTRDRVRARDARFVRRVEREFAGRLDVAEPDAPLAAPFELPVSGAAAGGATGGLLEGGSGVAAGSLPASGAAGAARAAVPPTPAGGGAAAGSHAAGVAGGHVTLRSRVIAAPRLSPCGGQDLALLAGAAAAGAGVVLAVPVAEPDGGAESAAHWHTIAAAVRRQGALLALAAPPDAALVCEADVLALPRVALGELSAARVAVEAGEWPAQRPLLLPVVAGPADEQVAGVGEVAALAAERSLITAVLAPRADDDGRALQALLCDALRAGAPGVPIALVDPLGTDEAATAVLAGRADLCLGRPRFDTPRWEPVAGRRIAEPPTRAAAAPPPAAAALPTASLPTIAAGS
ncbi:FAD-dependent monooxygenase [Conexibacter woesei]|uniref:Monooxygenase FAD-binding protein n=1 Tax=Conexibacter woesei (strain DSM 14684 / CCUG 47730 / CIP 108061 / JCM 11494 / NBRC 100937 / ID131577) TaxID=469383 RepID=D3FAS3_CONWI|nr:FAD-dependent monooxygenase [Conexibacter woesei]ADB51236.1 monooxygenase FAD-binding protein [Conexibacter woesei DSM 14684]